MINLHKHKVINNVLLSVTIVVLALFIIPMNVSGEEELQVSLHKKKQTSLNKIDVEQKFKRYKFSSGYHFEYPDAVRGIYVTGHTVGSNHFNKLLNLVENSDLNAMVIDIKDDYGKITFQPEKGSPYEDIASDYIKDPKQLMTTLEEKKIYPIARIVVFKDTELAMKRPDLSFLDHERVWLNPGGEAFVNPFEKEVWEYNIEIAKLAAKMGFKEIQFDYVRFPEGFEAMDKKLKYSNGDYADSKLNRMQRRVEAVTDFVAYAKKELEYYDVDVSVDIFGYAATIPETPGIGQNFSKISEHVDIISSMIYPSHWSNHFFGIPIPDMEPYRLVSEYAKVENEVLGKLKNPPISRPWIQDFEAPWIYQGMPTKQYGKKEVEAQIKALVENGINEYLIWNAGNVYSPNVNYKQ